MMTPPIAAEPVIEAELVDPPPRVERGRLRRAWDGVWWFYDGVVGLGAIVVGLAFIAAIPVLQMISLGYLLESAGRIVRQRRLIAGFIGLQPAARLGTIALCAWLITFPLRGVASMETAARLVNPGGTADRSWTIALASLCALAVVHIASAIYRGGRLRHFLWPAPRQTLRFLSSFLTFGQAYADARDAVCDAVAQLRLRYFFWLGLRGFVLGLVWLIVPVTLLAAGRKTPLLGFLGGLLLTIVVLYLPFLQARFAADNRWRTMFDVRGVRRLFKQAPWLFVVSLLITLALSLPLNLLKIELLPREIAPLPSLLFVAFNLPARWLTGWAISRAEKRTLPRWWLSYWPARLLSVPIAAAYVAIVYLTQFTSWYGIGSLYEQHAFLLPAVGGR